MGELATSCFRDSNGFIRLLLKRIKEIDIDENKVLFSFYDSFHKRKETKPWKNLASTDHKDDLDFLEKICFQIAMEKMLSKVIEIKQADDPVSVETERISSLWSLNSKDLMSQLLEFSTKENIQDILTIEKIDNFVEAIEKEFDSNSKF